MLVDVLDQALIHLMWMLVDVFDSLYVDTGQCFGYHSLYVDAGQCFELNYHSLYVDAKMSYHAQMTLLTQINVPLFFALFFLLPNSKRV